jgi:hypothetical protein
MEKLRRILDSMHRDPINPESSDSLSLPCGSNKLKSNMNWGQSDSALHSKMKNPKSHRHRPQNQSMRAWNDQLHYNYQNPDAYQPYCLKQKPQFLVI